MLLDLPPEVIQNILWHVDPGTLLVCLFVNKRFLELAHSKRILLHQLRSIPGLTVGIEDLNTYDAFMLFRRRATQNLCGSSVLAQLTKYPSGRRKVNVPLCVFYAGDPACLAVTYRDRAVISLYDFKEERIRPKVDLNAHLFQGEESDGHIELLKVAFSETRDVAGLYAYTPHIGNGGPLVMNAIARPTCVLRLVVFKYTPTPTEEDTDYPVRQETRDIFIRRGTEPVGLAIANDGLACIAWSRVDRRCATRISFYARSSNRIIDACGYDPSPQEFTVPEEDIRTAGLSLVCSMQFTCEGSLLNFYILGLPIPWCSMNLSRPMDATLTMDRNQKSLATGHLSPEFAMAGIPFYYNHIRDFALRSDGREEGCLTTLMAVVVAVRSEDHIAFIAEWNLEQAANMCEHQPKRMWTSWCTNWKALARLDGFKLDGFSAGRSSLGNVMAISPQGTRIALSEWAQLRVWALSPDAIDDKEQELYFPAADICDETGIGTLRHVELPSQGVIHSMCWQGEDRLYAMTDRGLVRWDVRPIACGRAESLSNNFDFEMEPVEGNSGDPVEASWEPS